MLNDALCGSGVEQLGEALGSRGGATQRDADGVAAQSEAVVARLRRWLVGQHHGNGAMEELATMLLAKAGEAEVGPGLDGAAKSSRALAWSVGGGGVLSGSRREQQGGGARF